ncbi:hypothetical protein HYW20_05115 [Candidatus Woesearchaeota archaeon]|nr:hypothetical protein [Candidatus Woesearchaeota archaeon]
MVQDTIPINVFEINNGVGAVFPKSFHTNLALEKILGLLDSYHSEILKNSNVTKQKGIQLKKLWIEPVGQETDSDQKSYRVVGEYVGNLPNNVTAVEEEYGLPNSRIPYEVKFGEIVIKITEVNGKFEQKYNLYSVEFSMRDKNALEDKLSHGFLVDDKTNIHHQVAEVNNICKYIISVWPRLKPEFKPI